MIYYLEGDIFSSPAQVIVNTVNTAGVMGKGIALEYKIRYPKMFESYKNACEKRKFQMGKLMICKEMDHLILLFPTKENWRHPSKLEYIEKGLVKFANTYADNNITSIAFPKLGCGNGELKWDEVKPLMEKYLKPLPIDIYIYLGINKDIMPEHKQPKEMQLWLRNNAKDMSFNGLVDDIHAKQGILPYPFTVDNKEILTTYNNGLIFSNDNFKTQISSDDLFVIWDEIRSNTVFKECKSDYEKFLIYELLSSLGYLTKIKLQDKASKLMINGYQLNVGLSRIYMSSEI